MGGHGGAERWRVHREGSRGERAVPRVTLTGRRVGRGSVLRGGEQGDPTQASLPPLGLKGNGDRSSSLPPTPHPSMRPQASPLVGGEWPRALQPASASPLGLLHSWSGWGPQSPPGTGEAPGRLPFPWTTDLDRLALGASCGDKDPSPAAAQLHGGLAIAAQTPPTPDIPQNPQPRRRWVSPPWRGMSRLGVPGEFRCGPTDVQEQAEGGPGGDWDVP